MGAEDVGPSADRQPVGVAVDPRIERTRAVVRQAVLDELGEVGYGALTIESVAARAGVAKSTIYRHWEDRLALIADAFESAHREMVPSTESGTVRECVERLIRHVAEVVVDSTFSRCIPALIEGAAHDPRLREFHHRYSAERRTGLSRLVAEGVASGDFAVGTDPELATTALLGAIFYGRLMSAQTFDPARASQLVDAVLPRARPRSCQPATSTSYDLVPIGWVESCLVQMEDEARQGEEGAPPAWLVFDDRVADALTHLHVDEEVIVLTWLDRAQRGTLCTYPEDEGAELFGVFNTRSTDLPNPIGLHRVKVLAREGLRIRVSPLDALDRTPIVDVKPVLDVVAEE